MADVRLATPKSLSSLNYEAMVVNTMIIGSYTTNASTAWPSASRAMYIPVACPGPFTIRKFTCHNGGAVSGNVDLGIYTSEGQLIISTGGTAQSGTGTQQVIDVTDTLIPPGWYYLAMVIDNGTGTNQRVASSAFAKRFHGCRQQASAYPLPSTATFADAADAYWPSFQATGVATI